MRQILSTALIIAMLSIAPIKNSFSFPIGEHLLGEIALFAGNYAPPGFAFCEGQVLKIKDNMTLFSILGSTYGGDGRTTFALPNLKEAEKSLNGARYIIAIEGRYPPRTR